MSKSRCYPSASAVAFAVIRLESYRERAAGRAVLLVALGAIPVVLLIRKSRLP